MTTSRAHLGDSHNFGRRVTLGDGVVHKPRTLLWEWLVLSAKSPLRQLLESAAKTDGLGDDAFGFLPDLAFSTPPPSRAFTAPEARDGGDVEKIELQPLGELDAGGRLELARVVGRSLALFSWLGVSDLHWENLVLGAAPGGRVVFAPLDVELLLAELSMPTETKLLPDADPEVATICRHACGVRRVLPWLGKPIEVESLLSMLGAYRRTLAFLDRNSQAISDVFSALPGLRTAPIRVLLRGTDEYVHAARTRQPRLWPPLLDEEKAQLDRGDIPYFFRLYGRAGIHWFSEPTLTELRTLPRNGDVPQLDPMLQVSRGLRGPTRKKLREEGLFTLVGAFNHPSFVGHHEGDGLSLTFAARTLALALPKGEELHSRRNLRDFVGSVYLPCHCGEVRTPFVPAVTVCEAKPER